ncbi:MAG: helix-turn-helix transcriptional regulator [Actinobacteria bacterium]|nr:helix-turn-helix transcriptional regulator [Actinomycetota bacterium]
MKDDRTRRGKAARRAGAPAGDLRAERPKTVELRDARALRALAHPTRLKLVGLLRMRGPMTATQAARELGETPQRCTFHLGQLAKYGLVEEAGGGRGRERPWRATASSTSWPNVMRGQEAAAASQLLEGVVAEQHFEELMAWVDHKLEEPEEWQQAAQLNDALVYLTADELAELGRRVWSLLERYEERNERPELRPDGSRPVAFLNLAFPRIRRGRAAPEAVDEAGPATPVQPRTADDSEPGPPAEPEAAGG